MQHINSIFRVGLTAIAVFAVTLFPSQPALAVATTQSMALPAYEYPTLTDLWPFIDSAGSQIPFVIVNPASGPGATANSDYTTRIAANDSAGILSIGYVDTNYQARSMTAVMDDIDTWYSLYPDIDGIFFDRVSVVGSADLCYSAYAYNYAKFQHPNDLVSQNFGTYTAPQYEPYGDIFLNAEMDYTLYQTWAAPSDGFQNVGSNSNRFWHLVHTTDSTDFSDTLALSRTNNAGWIYITDDILPNPYDAAATYWNTELTEIATLPASSIPNRGVTALPSGCIDAPATTTTSASANTASAVTYFTNDSLYQLPANTTTVAYTLPTGVTLASASGSDWSCTETTCTYDIALSTEETTAELAATFTADCTYEGEPITVTTTYFTNTSTTSSVAIAAPTDCPIAATPTTDSSTLAATGDNMIIATATGAGLAVAGGSILFVARRLNKENL
jgi:hypothetical protein